MRAEPGRAGLYMKSEPGFPGPEGQVFGKRDAFWIGGEHRLQVWPVRDSAGNYHGVSIECTVVAPPSSEGRSVSLYVEADMAEALMKELRSFAIRRRAKHEGVS